MPSPAQRTFSADVRDGPQAGATFIDLHGEINALADEALSAAYAEAANRGAEIVLLNFSDVDYINSTGIALIVGILAAARKAKHQLVTFGLSDHYLEIFQITRLSDFMAIYADEEDALKELAH
ncbi:MAG: STAS domain-containing protein [Caldilineaceae bacterium]|nr:STAS domain-containing protein [Caldilineaceae bacterium]